MKNISINQISESIDKLDMNIKCMIGLLEIVHLGMLSMYDSNDDSSNFELAFLHTLKKYMYDLCENDLKELHYLINHFELYEL